MQSCGKPRRGMEPVFPTQRLDSQLWACQSRCQEGMGLDATHPVPVVRLTFSISVNWLTKARAFS
jgi:hypothetical protein